MFKRLLAATLGLALLAPTSLAAQTSKADELKVNLNLRVSQKDELPEPIAREMQALLAGVGCPDWNRENGKWGPSSAGQFTAFLRKTGQTKRYAAMKQPSVAEIRTRLFNGWTPQKDFIATLRTDAKYCEPSAQDIKLLVDLTVRQDETDLPDGLPETVAKELQRNLEDVGCPAWNKDDGVWGPSSSLQFENFLNKTEQLEKYAALRQPTVRQIKQLFSQWKAQKDFIPTLNTDYTYCQPLLHGGEDTDKATSVDFDLRIPQPKLEVPVAKSLQTLLGEVGCPDWGKEVGKWGPSSAGQFVRFLSKTQQTQRYESIQNTTLHDIKKLFSGWTPKPDFRPFLNDKPQYCEPIARCNLNGEVSKLLSESSDAAPLRDLYLTIHGWNKNLPKQKNARQTLFPGKTDDALKDLRDKLAEAEMEIRGLFRRAVELKNPETCGLCTHKINYEIALSVGLDDITKAQLEEHHDIWKDVEVLRRSILTKETLRQSKEQSMMLNENLKRTRAADKRAVAHLTKLIEADQDSLKELVPLIESEQLYLATMLSLVRKGIAEEIDRSRSRDPVADLRVLMEATTCFVGEGPYVIE